MIHKSIKMNFYPETYRCLDDTLKITILCSAFISAKSMNHWGCITPIYESYFQAGIELWDLGTNVLPCIWPSLKDPTLLHFGWSAETNAMMKKFKWRKKDIAYCLAARILKEKPIFLEKPKKRDRIIKKFILKNEKLVMKNN
jgi:hypothetical protein